MYLSRQLPGHEQSSVRRSVLRIYSSLYPVSNCLAGYTSWN